MSWGVATQNGVSVSLASIVSISCGATEFSPASLFTSGVQGAWYDPSDYSSLFQDSAGTTAVTAVEQPVGLMLDKSQGLVLGSERIGATWGVLDASWSQSGSDLIAVNGTSFGAYQLGLTIGLWYKITFEIYSYASGTLNIRVGNGSGVTVGAAANGVYTAYGICAGDTSFYFMGSGTFNGRVRNISVKAIAGNHALQATSASRPVLRARYNLLTYSEQFDNALWIRTGFDAFGSGSVANATTAPDGATTADFIRPGTVSSSQRFTQNPSPTQTAQTLSLYVKASGYSKVALKESATTGNYASFDLSNGTVLANTVGVGTSITALPNSWYRISMALASAGSCGLQISVLAPAYTTGDPNSSTFSGDGTSGVFIWGAMLNPGSSAGTYQRIAAATDYATTGFLPYLALVTDDSMATGSIDFSATDKMAVVAGVTKNNDASAQIICELSATSSTGNNGSFAIISALSPSNYAFYLYGTALASRTATTYASPITNVLSVKYDISQSTVPNEVAPQINGVIPTLADAGGAGTGNFGNYPLYIGRRNNASLPFDGRIYQMVVVGKTLSASELASTEAFVNTKTGAY